MSKKKKKKKPRLKKNPIDMSLNHFRDIINHRLDELDKTRYWLVGRAGSSEAVVYRFLGGHAETTSNNVRQMLKAVGLEMNVIPGFDPEAPLKK